jgi:hypothetical protein
MQMQEVMGSLTPSGSQLEKDKGVFEVLELMLSTASKWTVEMPSASVCFWIIQYQVNQLLLYSVLS